jgi:hypothetical protein
MCVIIILFVIVEYNIYTALSTCMYLLEFLASCIHSCIV